MNTARRTATGAFLLASLIAAPAAAQPVAFAFTAHVTGYEVLQGDPAWARQAMPRGTPLRGRYTFDASTPDRDPNRFAGEFTHDPVARPEYGFHAATIAGYRMGNRAPPPGSEFTIGVLDDFPLGPLDSYTAMQTALAVEGGTVPLRFASINIGASTAQTSWLASDALPLTPPDIFGPGVEAGAIVFMAPVDGHLAPVNVLFELNGLTLVPCPGAAIVLAFAAARSTRTTRQQAPGAREERPCSGR